MNRTSARTPPIPLGDDDGHPDEAHGDADGLARANGLAEEHAAEEDDEDRRGGVDQADIGRRRGLGADIDDGAADPHAQRPEDRQVAPFRQDRPAAVPERLAEERHQQEEGDGPAPEREGDGRRELMGVARHHHVGAEHRRRHQQQEIGPAGRRRLRCRAVSRIRQCRVAGGHAAPIRCWKGGHHPRLCGHRQARRMHGGLERVSGGCLGRQARRACSCSSSARSSFASLPDIRSSAASSTCWWCSSWEVS